MWILDSRFPYLHPIQNEQRTVYTLVGYEEAFKLALAFKTLLEQTHQQAQSLKATTGEIVKDFHEIVKLSPKDAMSDGVG